jgi:hypothetical protein
MLTPEREKAIREWHKTVDSEYEYHLHYLDIYHHFQDLFEEIDSLRAKLSVAEEALIFSKQNGIMCGHDDPTWCTDKCRVVWVSKKALQKIQSDK